MSGQSCVFCDIIAGKQTPADYYDYGPVVRFTPRNGADASQTIPHLHWHVVPRAAGDGLHLPWTGQKRDSHD